MIPNIYLNLEDDVSKIVEKVKKLHTSSAVLVCPKRCFLFNDSINLRLLKKQTDLLGKEIFILTMDEKGQLYSKEAGFELKFLSKPQNKSFLDIQVNRTPKKAEALSRQEVEQKKPKIFKSSIKNIKHAGNLVFKKAEVAEKSSPGILVSDSEFPAEIKQAHDIKIHKKRNQRVIFTLAALSLLTLLVLFFIILPKAEVTIYPKTEPLTRDMEISLGTGVQQPDVTRLVLPAKAFSTDLRVKDTFLSQGKKEIGNKAKGSIKIYNFTKKPLNLKASTTTLTVGSKNYFLTQDVNSLKPTGYKNAQTKEVDENTLGPSFEIIAQDGGESSNLPQGVRVEITNKVFGSNPKFLYAMTDSAIVGGTSRFLSYVNEQDVATAKEALNTSLVESLNTELAKESLTATADSYTLENPVLNTDKPIGTESPNFTANLSTKAKGLAFNSEQLYKLVSDRINQSLPGDRLLSPQEQNEMTYKIKSIDFNAETAVLLVHFDGKSISKIDIKDFAKSLTGKNKNQINSILQSRTDIEKIDVLLAPSWQQYFPFFAKKIIVNSSY